VSGAATVIPSLALVDIWQWTPMITLIVLAGLAALPPEPYESARVDGASGIQTFIHITLPMLAPTILTAMILRAVDALKTFDIIFAMTGGGPGYSSETLNIMAFKYSFEYFRMGQSSVILVFLFFLILALSLVIMRLRRRFEL
ncbi:MAG TPA: sugar ABC transporter permease, partial [Magnetospirillaceae bacterium]|nr:sugar ABC transporter permease [Magnetospirillaceae bacterium]